MPKINNEDLLNKFQLQATFPKNDPEAEEYKSKLELYAKGEISEVTIPAKYIEITSNNGERLFGGGESFTFSQHKKQIRLEFERLEDKIPALFWKKVENGNIIVESEHPILFVKAEITTDNKPSKLNVSIKNKNIEDVHQAYRYYSFLFRFQGGMKMWICFSEDKKEEIILDPNEENNLSKEDEYFLQNLEIRSTLDKVFGEDFRKIGIDLSQYPLPKVTEVDGKSLSRLYNFIQPDGRLAFTLTSDPSKSNFIKDQLKEKKYLGWADNFYIQFWLFDKIVELKISGQAELEEVDPDNYKYKIVFTNPQFKVEEGQKS